MIGKIDCLITFITNLKLHKLSIFHFALYNKASTQSNDTENINCILAEHLKMAKPIQDCNFS